MEVMPHAEQAFELGKAHASGKKGRPAAFGITVTHVICSVSL